MKNRFQKLESWIDVKLWPVANFGLHLALPFTVLCSNIINRCDILLLPMIIKVLVSDTCSSDSVPGISQGAYL